MDVGTEASGPHEDREARLGVVAQDAIATGRREQFDRSLDGQLVRCDVVGDAGLVLTTLEVRTVPTDTRHDRDTIGVGADRDRVDGPRVDVAEAFGHHHSQARLTVPEVEVAQPWDGLALAARDRIEVVLHARGERVVDEVGEVLLEQRDDREGGERGHQRRAPPPHVPAVLDRADDRRIRRRSADTQFLESLHEGRLGEASRRLGFVALRYELESAKRVTDRKRRQPPFFVVAARLVLPFDVDPTEAGDG